MSKKVKDLRLGDSIIIDDIIDDFYHISYLNLLNSSKEQICHTINEIISTFRKYKSSILDKTVLINEEETAYLKLQTDNNRDGFLKPEENTFNEIKL